MLRLFSGNGANLEMFISPLVIGNSNETWSVMIAAREDHVLSDVNGLTLFTIITALIMVAAVAVVIYFVLHFTMKPIVNANDLASNMNETAAAVNEITANIQSIKVRIINQSASVTETNATMEQVTININKLNGNIENQTSHVSQASAAIEQMVANISSVTDTLVKNAANVKTLTDASEVGKGGLQEVSADIQEIARESEGLL